MILNLSIVAEFCFDYNVRMSIRLWSDVLGLPVLAPIDLSEDDSAPPDALRVARTHIQADGFVPADKGTPLRVVGHVSAAFVDPEKGVVLGLLVGYTQVLPLVDVRVWESNHLEIHSEEDLVPPDELVRLEEFGLRRCFFAAKRVELKGKGRTRTLLHSLQRANVVGRLRDFVFDTLTGALISITSEQRFLFWHWDERIFPASDIFEITERAIILNLDSLEVAQKERPNLNRALFPLSQEA